MQRGFTLLEILVVLMMVGVLMGIAVTTLTFDRTEQRLITHSDAFVQLYRAAQDEALLSGQPLRIKLMPQGWQLEKRVSYQWTAFSLTENAMLHLPEGLVAELSPNKPMMIMPSGQSSPFTLKLSEADFYRFIRSDGLGRLRQETQ